MHVLMLQENNLHRETLYLSVDFLDRYLSRAVNVPKRQLQLVGITSLFIASKMEEILPPMLWEFSEVTARTCTDDDITKMELALIERLGWGLTPQTPNRWLKTYMQINSQAAASAQAENLEVATAADFVAETQFDRVNYLRAMQLMDLVTLDTESLKFRYSVLAAAVIYHCHDEQSALQSSGNYPKCYLFLGSYTLP